MLLLLLLLLLLLSFLAQTLPSVKPLKLYVDLQGCLSSISTSEVFVLACLLLLLINA